MVVGRRLTVVHGFQWVCAADNRLKWKGFKPDLGSILIPSFAYNADPQILEYQESQLLLRCSVAPWYRVRETEVSFYRAMH